MTEKLQQSLCSINAGGGDPTTMKTDVLFTSLKETIHLLQTSYGEYEYELVDLTNHQPMEQHHNPETQPAVCELMAYGNQPTVEWSMAVCELVDRNPAKDNDEWGPTDECNWTDMFTYHARIATAAAASVEQSQRRASETQPSSGNTTEQGTDMQPPTVCGMVLSPLPAVTEKRARRTRGKGGQSSHQGSRDDQPPNGYITEQGSGMQPSSVCEVVLPPLPVKKKGHARGKIGSGSQSPQHEVNETQEPNHPTPFHPFYPPQNPPVQILRERREQPTQGGGGTTEDGRQTTPRRNQSLQTPNLETTHLGTGDRPPPEDEGTSQFPNPRARSSPSSRRIGSVRWSC